MRFRATVELNGKTATGIEVPAEVVTGLGGSRRPAVRATINGYTYRSSIASMGGRYLLSVSGEVRQGAGIAAGDDVEVDVELDTEKREVVVPADLADALARDPAAAAAFGKLSYSHQRQHVLAIEEAKAAETRRRRVEKTLAMLRGQVR